MSIPKRPLKILFFIAYILTVIGIALTEPLDLGFKLLTCGLLLIIFVIAYILISKLV
jgi:hypothetical protein